MGRPREFTPEERETLIAGGYRPVEVWVAEADATAYWAEFENECREIAASEDEAEVDLFIEAAAQDVFRLIDEEEAAAKWKR